MVAGESHEVRNFVQFLSGISCIMKSLFPGSGFRGRSKGFLSFGIGLQAQKWAPVPHSGT
jgi:hypothetical protein